MVYLFFMSARRKTVFEKNTNRDWEKIGKSDPYFGVLTVDQYKTASLTEDEIKKFFLTGETYVEDILKTIHEKIDKDFVPKHALDFGCGVGRILLPLSRRVETITGIDVSLGMVNEAARNCQAFNVTNSKLIRSDGFSIGVTEKYDFIHSFIVFQHIPVKQGMHLFNEMLDHLEENGVGVIHFTYYRKASRIFGLVYSLIIRSSIFSGLWNFLRGDPITAPILQMNMYDPGELLRVLQDCNCHNIHISFTKHNDVFYGILIFFQKKANIISGVD